MMPGPNHIYNAGDIARYRSGKMTDAEMHAMEKAAARDPFLADAIEGYAHAETPEKDVAELREKISGLSGRSRRTIMPMWLKIAAVFVLILGGVYTTWIINSREESPQFAKELKAKENKNEETPSLPVVKDSSLVTSSELSTKESEPKSVTQENKGRNLVTKKTEPAMTEEKLMNADTVREYSTKVAEDSKLAGNDSEAVVTAQGIKRQEKELNRDLAKSKAEKDMPSPQMDEVQVTTMNKRSERYANTATRNKQEVLKLNYNDSTQAPLGGWDNFRQYVFENLEAPKNEKGENYNGVVVLSFEVNRKGDPKNVKVEESLCKVCDKEATRLLENGPRWKYGRGRRSLEIKL